MTLVTPLCRGPGSWWHEPEAPTGFKAAKERVIDAFTRDYLQALLDKHQGNVSAVAREAGLNRNHVAELATKLGLKVR